MFVGLSHTMVGLVLFGLAPNQGLHSFNYVVLKLKPGQPIMYKELRPVISRK
jgi:hypothetical protein